MYKKPTLSIITVCLNEPLLQRTCESIVNQKFQNFEWIVIDGGSNEATLNIFERYKYRINYFVSESDGGIYFGMNKGIQQAHGTWLNFMNAGDLFINYNILNIINYKLKKIKKIDILYGNYIVGDSNIIIPAPKPNKDNFYFKNFCHQCSFVRNKILKKYKFDTQFKICADWDLWNKLFFRGYMFRHIDLGIARFYENGMSHINKKDVFKEISYIRKKYYTKNDILKLKENQIQNLRKMINNR